MRSFQIVVAAALLAMLKHLVDAAPANGVDKRAISSIVSGSTIGFASGATGGGSAATVYPTTIAELKEYLTSSEPQNIVISGTFDFVGSEGTSTYSACNVYACTPSSGGQALLNTLGGCGSLSTYSVKLDTAAITGIPVKSDKTLVGRDNAVLNGKGLRFAGVSNIIIQNIEITNLNPEYVWGGDAFVFSDTSNIWIDHVTTSSLGRQHYSFGQSASDGITISNSFINGKTGHSASCDGHTYWGLELVGSSDQITFYKNHVYYTSGRSPALSGNTLFHAVNNVWSSNSGHLIEGTSNGMGVYEGNYFDDAPTIVASGFVGRLFGSESADLSQCTSYLGRNCVANSFYDSGSFNYDHTDFLYLFEGKTDIVSAASASSIQRSVVSSAGNTL
ncbi:polysaccharide lyase family 1 protein [Talaromyces proteolyticus]|uniref:pectin lyase n=1 Tax=Talaromyces proteolyticus TaxID=1131652 RepID=A0AAD4Q685_9EURO|nr:polysaccharide lyase family 1 protein [Talaromyces proteolyticus]KAH8705431.1 polysaccharide lyase family 1 protein [Talaromyces proteolyticus]